MVPIALVLRLRKALPGGRQRVSCPNYKCGYFFMSIAAFDAGSLRTSEWTDWQPSRPRFDFTLRPLWFLFLGLMTDLSGAASDYVRSSRAAMLLRHQRYLQSQGGYTKRVVDVVIATIALIALAPLMALIGLVIKLTVGGDVFFVHRRVGHNGTPFPCLKFRTMVANADEALQRYLADNPAAAVEWHTAQKLTRDPRVTFSGSLIRKSSIDELPQRVNVLLGEMSIVGPRPVVVAELERYGPYARDYVRARPGLTGLWQVNGRSRRSYRDRIALDRFYVRRWSMGLDFMLLLKTIPAVLNFEDAA